MNKEDVLKIRKSLKLTQEEFGQLIGVDKRTIMNYEKGKVIPRNKIGLFKLILSKESNILSLKENDKEELKNESLSSESNERLLTQIESLKDHINTLKEFLTEKTTVAEFYKIENIVLKEEIERLKNA
jgi:DNA-binding XRE family transcriptional regulator